MTLTPSFDELSGFSGWFDTHMCLWIVLCIVAQSVWAFVKLWLESFTIAVTSRCIEQLHHLPIGSFTVYKLLGQDVFCLTLSVCDMAGCMARAGSPLFVVQSWDVLR